MSGRWPLLLSLALLASCAVTAPQAVPTKTYLIGYLTAGTRSDTTIQIDAFRSGLRNLGYVEGQNLRLEIRWAEDYNDRLPELAAELVALKPDLIVAENLREALALKQATSTIPIVFASVPDPVENGVVTSLAKPGGNITGVGRVATGVVQRRLQLLKEAVPVISRLGFLYAPYIVSQLRLYQEAQTGSPALGLTVVPVPAHEDIALALSAAAGAHLDALYLTSAGLLLGQKAVVLEFAAANRLPTMSGGGREFVDAGGLMFYGEDLTNGVRRSTQYVDRILKGARPADLPIEMTSKFDFIINLKTARALGLTIPKSVLDQATEFVQ